MGWEEAAWAGEWLCTLSCDVVHTEVWVLRIPHTGWTLLVVRAKGVHVPQGLLAAVACPDPGVSPHPQISPSGHAYQPFRARPEHPTAPPVPCLWWPHFQTHADSQACEFQLPSHSAFAVSLGHTLGHSKLLPVHSLCPQHPQRLAPPPCPIWDVGCHAHAHLNPGQRLPR